FRETRELHTLGAFDLVNLRRELAADVGRFAGATALTEVMLKMAPPAPLAAAYDTLTGALDALELAPSDQVDAAAVRAVWCLLAVLGFEPSLTRCARDGAAIDPAATEPVPFSVADGGALCARCAPAAGDAPRDRKSTRLNSSHQIISYAVFCLKKKIKNTSANTE